MDRERLKRYFRANPGAVFIITFQALLVSAAVALATGSSWANEFGIFAFYALVVGVAIQLGVLVREERRRTRANSGGEAKPP